MRISMRISNKKLLKRYTTVFLLTALSACSLSQKVEVSKISSENLALDSSSGCSLQITYSYELGALSTTGNFTANATSSKATIDSSNCSNHALGEIPIVNSTAFQRIGNQLIQSPNGINPNRFTIQGGELRASITGSCEQGKYVENEFRSGILSSSPGRIEYTLKRTFTEQNCQPDQSLLMSSIE